MRVAYFEVDTDPNMKTLKVLKDIESVTISWDYKNLVCDDGNEYHSIPVDWVWIITNDRRSKKHG